MLGVDKDINESIKIVPSSSGDEGHPLTALGDGNSTDFNDHEEIGEGVAAALGIDGELGESIKRAVTAYLSGKDTDDTRSSRSAAVCLRSTSVVPVPLAASEVRYSTPPPSNRRSSTFKDKAPPRLESPRGAPLEHFLPPGIGSTHDLCAGIPQREAYGTVPLFSTPQQMLDSWWKAGSPPDSSFERVELSLERSLFPFETREPPRCQSSFQGFSPFPLHQPLPWPISTAENVVASGMDDVRQDVFSVVSSLISKSDVFVPHMTSATARGHPDQDCGASGALLVDMLRRRPLPASLAQDSELLRLRQRTLLCCVQCLYRDQIEPTLGEVQRRVQERGWGRLEARTIPLLCAHEPDVYEVVAPRRGAALVILLRSPPTWFSGWVTGDSENPFSVGVWDELTRCLSQGAFSLTGKVDKAAQELRDIADPFLFRFSLGELKHLVALCVGKREGLSYRGYRIQSIPDSKQGLAHAPKNVQESSNCSVASGASVKGFRSGDSKFRPCCLTAEEAAWAIGQAVAQVSHGDLLLSLLKESVWCLLGIVLSEHALGCSRLSEVFKLAPVSLCFMLSQDETHRVVFVRQIRPCPPEWKPPSLEEFRVATKRVPRQRRSLQQMPAYDADSVGSVAPGSCRPGSDATEVQWQ